MFFKIYNFVFIKLEYYILTLLNYIIPKDKNNIFIFDKKFKKDNVWAIAKYLSDNKEYKTYNIYYYTKEYRDSYSNIIFISNPIYALLKQLSSKYIFYSYRGDGIKLFKFKKDQVVLDTMHGSPLKNIGYLTGNSKFKKLWKFESSFSNILCVSDFFKDVIKRGFGAEEKQCITLGYPRNDIIFDKKMVLEKLNVNKEEYSKIVLWVPTWRTSTYQNYENKINVDYPILNLNNIGILNDFLLVSEVLLIIKPHPYQLDLEIFNKKYSNIIVFRNKDLENNKVEFYQIFNEVDALLTDYSSIYFDFLLTMKPIGFTIDDFDSYEAKYGFVIDNPLEIMPGEKITNLEQLISFIVDLKEGKDLFYKQRKLVNDIANKYKDEHSTKRIVEYLGL